LFSYFELNCYVASTDQLWPLGNPVLH